VAAPKTKSLTEQEKLRSDVLKLSLRGCTQVAIAGMVGISQGRVSQILKESVETWRARRVRESPEELVAKKLEQLQDVMVEAFSGWERSKEDSVCTTEQSQLKTVYQETVIAGKTVRIPSGEKLVVVRATKKLESRIPETSFLNTVLKCLQEESRLLGLTDDTVVKIINNNVNGNQLNVGIDWGKMQGPTDMTADEVEAKIATVALPPPDPQWSESEVKLMDDEPEHLNGDG
jgi:predicted transcriptional regulator